MLLFIDNVTALILKFFLTALSFWLIILIN